MADYSPTNNSIEHLEFTDTTQYVAIVNQELHQWKVQKITGYSTSNGVEFPDLVFSVSDPINGSQGWSYSSRFEYAVNRLVRYVVVSDDQTTLTCGEVNNITKLPEVYDNLYYSAVPDPSMTVTMHLQGLQRTGTKSTVGEDSDSGQGGTEVIHWSAWGPWEDSYTITITTNMDKHREVLQAAVMQQRFVKNSPTKPEW